MPPRQSTLVCRSCGLELPRDAFDNRYKPNGGLRGKRLDCRACLQRSAETVRDRIESAYIPNPSGLCMCGCQTPVPRAWRNRPNRGWVKGEYVRYVTGHISHVALSDVEYIVDETSGCWLWQRGQDGHGYGVKFVSGGKEKPDKMDKAHRVYYREAKGEIPEGFDLHHLCANPACVNPDHLVPMDRIEHMAADGRLAKVRAKRS